MAIFHVEYFSNALRRVMPLTVLLPVEAPDIPGMPPQPSPIPFRTLYLLHGYSGSHRDWLHGSRIDMLSRLHRVAVVMPSSENSFYLDDEVRGAMYGKMTGEEIVSFTRTVFPLSDKRGDTAIAGLSMGGFGAMRTGLRYPETFGSIVALSSAFITDMVDAMKPEDPNPIAPYSYYRHTFGEMGQVLGSDRDPKALARRLVEADAALPRIYMACGAEDFLIESNRSFHAHLETLGVPHDYTEGTGVHDWVYWDAHIERAMEWLYGKPLVPQMG